MASSPNTEYLLQFFTYEHLTHQSMREVSRQYTELALWTVENTTAGPEQTTALRKLLEAKDCAVRTVVADMNQK